MKDFTRIAIRQHKEIEISALKTFTRAAERDETYMSAPLLVLTNFDEDVSEFILYADACGSAIGGILSLLESEFREHVL